MTNAKDQMNVKAQMTKGCATRFMWLPHSWGHRVETGHIREPDKSGNYKKLNNRLILEFRHLTFGFLPLITPRFIIDTTLVYGYGL